jgi:hypothetical protein
LQAVIADIRKLLNSPVGRHAVGVEVVVREGGYSPTSSTGKLRLAAWRSFGLLNTVEGGKDRMVRLSPLALDIVADYADGSPQQVEAIKKAALTPRMHNDLYTRYGIPLPPDDEIRRYLVRERGFNDKTVGEFIEEYKATISFAKLTGADKMASADAPANGYEQGEEGVDDPGEQVRRQRRRHMQPGMKEAVLPLGEGDVVVRYPERISSQSLEDLEDWMQLMIRRMKRSVVDEGSEPEPDDQ